MRDFRQLEIWKRSHALTIKIYELTKSFPKDELYGITSQIRRAAVSVPTNIAEGCGRSGDNEFSRFLIISLGSASELDYLLQVAHDLGYSNDDDIKDLQNEIIEIKHMIDSLVNNIRKDKA